MRVFITGASGFIGSHLAKRCVELGYHTNVLSRPGVTAERLKPIEKDIVQHKYPLDPGGVYQALKLSMPQWIFHLAAYGVNPKQQENGYEVMTTNVGGTAAILDAATHHGFEAFVNAGSATEYGFRQYFANHDELTEPMDRYGISKLAATQLVQLNNHKSGRAMTLRLYTPFGPGEPEYRFIPSLVRSVVSKQPMTISSPSNSRDFIYIDDVVDAFLAAAEKGQDRAIYNIGAGREILLRDAVKVAQDLYPDMPTPVIGGRDLNRPVESRCAAAYGLMQLDTGWMPKTSFVNGFLSCVYAVRAVN